MFQDCFEYYYLRYELYDYHANQNKQYEVEFHNYLNVY